MSKKPPPFPPKDKKPMPPGKGGKPAKGKMPC